MLDTVQFRCLAVAWQKCMRASLKVPYRTHVSLLPAISGVSLASVQIKCRMLANSFASQCLVSSSPVIRPLARFSVLSNLHVVGSNMSQIASELNFSVRDVIANPSLFYHYKNILIQSHYPEPQQSTKAREFYY